MCWHIAILQVGVLGIYGLRICAPNGGRRRQLHDRVRRIHSVLSGYSPHLDDDEEDSSWKHLRRPESVPIMHPDLILQHHLSDAFGVMLGVELTVPSR